MADQLLSRRSVLLRGGLSASLAKEYGPKGVTTAAAGQPSKAMIEVDPDYDEDGFRLSDGDCNDLNAAINPEATERKMKRRAKMGSPDRALSPAVVNHPNMQNPGKEA